MALLSTNQVRLANTYDTSIGSKIYMVLSSTQGLIDSKYTKMRT